MGETAYYELDQNDAQKIKVSRIHTTYWLFLSSLKYALTYILGSMYSDGFKQLLTYT